jgi:hypothetical protein
MRSDLLAVAGASSGPIVNLSPTLDDPPDLTAALESLIVGTASMQLRPGRLALPLLVQRGAAVVQRSQDLLSMFRVLCHSLEDCGRLV